MMLPQDRGSLAMRSCAPLVRSWLFCIAVTAVLSVPLAAGEMPTPAQAVAPVTPELPTGVVEAMQEGRYAEAASAIAGLQRAAGASDDAKAYLGLLRGVALR